MDGAHHGCYHDAMERTTISLPVGLLQRLRVIAAEQRMSMAALVRETLEEKTRSYLPRPRSLGIGASAWTDTSRRSGDERAEPRPWR